MKKFARHKSNGRANFPFLVEVQNTENWNTTKAFLSEHDAVTYAEKLAETFPKLPIRVHHYTGGPI